ncbi:hypothetical protein H310_04154 [Aphanomyces invadans]|uniref:Tc3 transposase DNA binding domain-containing protein n=1 Tax=Aphanomyces invadans TaxID=157072 RepID=A0A024UFF4_9STRA|nr:hypothetical protein H310_04154 [Aphanomyces invadans]ETW05146.1 hypothetical protein H310_04154 [Aphanomyces invadans]|eukprot:XP_008866584.1 hypothetical protein H310_04154 [Aphanomyces invadans]
MRCRRRVAAPSFQVTWQSVWNSRKYPQYFRVFAKTRNHDNEFSKFEVASQVASEVRSMPRGRHLSAAEQSTMLAMHHSGRTQKEIAQVTGRGKSVIRTFLANPEVYGSTKRQGRPRKLSPQLEQHILDIGREKRMNAREIIQDLGLHGVQVRQVQRLLQQDKRRQDDDLHHRRDNANHESRPDIARASMLLSMSDVDDDAHDGSNLHEVTDTLCMLDDI